MESVEVNNDTHTFYNVLLQTRASRVLREHIYESLAEFSVSMTEWMVMALLNSYKKMKLVDLAEQLDVEAPLITNTIDLMISKNLVTKEASEGDKRAKSILLSPNGKRLLPKIEKKVEEKMKLIFRGLSEQEFKSYMKVIRQIVFP